MNFVDKYRRILSGRPIRNHLKVYDDDVFMVSYPRSGNTWARFLIGTIVSNQPVDWRNFESIIPDIYRNSQSQLNKLRRPRILKSHHSYDKRYQKVIYLIRDLRDVFISYYNFKMKFKRNNDLKDIDKFMEAFLIGDLDDFGTWKQNVQSWISNKEKISNGMLLIKYEDLLANTINETKHIMEFLQITRSEEEIRRAIEWASFENMRILENQQQDSDLFKDSDKSLKFTKKGKSGNWKDLLDPHQVERLIHDSKELMTQFGYIGA